MSVSDSMRITTLERQMCDLTKEVKKTQEDLRFLAERVASGFELLGNAYDYFQVDP